MIVFSVLGWMIARPWAAIPLLILGWGLFVLASPYRACRWCKKGTRLRRLVKQLPIIGRGRCFRCHGRKLTRRLGAYHVHKVKLSLIQAWEERGDGQ